MVADPADYPWSSYRFNALVQVDSLVTPHFELQRLGCDDGERQAAYRDLFTQALSETQINEIRDATNKAWVLGECIVPTLRVGTQPGRSASFSPRA